ncbi:MAG: hypothetical protein C0501_23525 [Isosphaera sp.]|nr:hypothetical protein [Isosphaera sp.]
MPSRRGAVLIVAFWLAVTGYVGYRDVWPVVAGSDPPAVALDLADEAARNVPARWTVYRTVSGHKVKAGGLTTRTTYVEADDTFRFTHEYRNLRLEVGPLGAVSVPEFRTAVRVTRGGDLREQTAEGRFEILAGGLKFGEATVRLAGAVADGLLSAAVDGSFTFGGATESLSQVLDPVPVPEGQPLTAMQPVHRLTGVRAGRRWAVHESDPVGDAIKAALKAKGINPPAGRTGHLIGEVLSGTQPLEWKGQPVACRVIDYRRAGVLEVRTWVRDPDGKVLKQEAFYKGETLSVERDE